MTEAMKYTQEELDAAVQAAREDVQKTMQLVVGTIKAQREQANDQVVDLNVAAQTAQTKAADLEKALAEVRKEFAALQESIAEQKSAGKARPKTAK